MEGITVNPPYSEKTSRMEMLWRILYWIVYMIVAMIMMMIMYITLPLQFLAMLILGKRVEILHKYNRMAMEYMTQYMTYLYLLTDERPPFIPNLDALK